MGLKSTRKIITALLTALIIFSLEAAVIGFMGTAVAGNKKLYVNAIANQTLASECEKQLDSKYTVLSHQTGIPKDVFTSVTVKYDTLSSLSQAAEYLFDENDAELKNDARKQYFTDTCKEYLNANGIKYNEADIEKTAQAASDIYSDTVGIHNLEFLKNTVNRIRENSAKAMSFFIVFAAMGIGCVCLMYKKKEQRLLYSSYGIIAGGVATVFTSLIALVFREHKTFGVYYEVFYDMQKTQLLFLLLGGAVLFAIGGVIFAASIKTAKTEERRKNTRFSKIVDKL